jgi:drug/metabolite transporter (DMT)-like permease
VTQHTHTLPRSTWLLLAALTFGWGFNWPMMKLAVAEIPVWSFRGICVVLGALALDTGRWHPLSPAAVFAVAYNVVIAFVLCYWAWHELVATASAGVSAIGTRGSSR